MADKSIEIAEGLSEKAEVLLREVRILGRTVPNVALRNFILLELTRLDERVAHLTTLVRRLQDEDTVPS